MPLTHIEMPLNGDVTCGAASVGVLQKRINLPPGNRYEIHSIDIFDDNGSVGIPKPNPDRDCAIVYYITPFPISTTDMPWGNMTQILLNQGPMAGNDSVLYKKIGICQKEPDGTLWIWSQYPTEQIAAEKGKTWYSPHLYVTVLWYSEPDEIYNVNCSVSIGVKTRKVSRLMSAKNNYAEFLDAQMALLENTAVNIPLDRLVGQTFPMWKFGGIRPELVMSSSNVLTYYHNSELLNPETATSRAALQAQYIASQTMVGFDEAFGSEILRLPSWLNITASGISTGPIRQQWPPNKYADNGNTLTF